MVTLYAALIEGEYFYGAARNPSAAHAAGTQWWIGLRLEEDTRHFTIETAEVPEDKCAAFEGHGVSGEQVYSDGYEARNEWAKYNPTQIDEYVRD